jgi:serine phosphatase RsbU (regulator of sigma subunit)
MRILIAALLALALALAVRSGLAGLRARRLERQRQELLQDVGLLQAALLPATPPRLGPVGTSAAYRPADGPGAGGDFYDLFALDSGQIAVLVGDVSGHGRAALPHTALVRFTLRAYLEAGLSPREALQTAGSVLERQLGESFVTAVAATYQPRERVLTYACAGHPPPVVLGSRMLAPVTACSAPPIACGMRTGTRQTVLALPGACTVCFYTDGIPEARVGAELFGIQRLMRALSTLGDAPDATSLLERVAQESDARPDDMAACLLSIEGGSEPPAALLEELELTAEEAESGRTRRFLLACGVQPAAIERLADAARAQAQRTGVVLLRAHLSQGSVHVTLREESVRLLHAARGERAALGGAAR